MARRHESVPVLLDAGGPESRETKAVNRALPCEELLDGERVAPAGVFEAQQAAADRRDNFGLPADHPALRVRRWQVGERQRTAIGTDDVADTSSAFINAHAKYHSRLPTHGRR